MAGYGKKREPVGGLALRAAAGALDRLTSAMPFDERCEQMRIRDLLTGKEVPFKWNSAQRAYWDRRPKRGKVLVLKYRQGGFTTLEMADSYDRFKRLAGSQQLFLADEGKKAGRIFGIARKFYGTDLAKPRLREEPSSSLMEARNGSWIMVGTAGAQAFGRGFTVDKAHGSEVSRWRGSRENVEDLVVGLQEAAKSGLLVLETTANGVDNWFYERWQEPRDWVRVFIPWFSDATCAVALDAEGEAEIFDTLTDEERSLVEKHKLWAGQIAWRRKTQLSMGRLFPQEYPESAETAFLMTGPTLFDTEMLAEALRLATPPLKVGQSRTLEYEQFIAGPVYGQRYVIGADVAEGHVSGDWSAYSIRDRQGALAKIVRCKDQPDEFAYRLAEEGLRWNVAEIAPERNSVGRSTVDTLANRIGYPNVHRELRWNGRVWVPSGASGWLTTGPSKAEMLRGYKEAFEAGTWAVPSRLLVSDMLRVTRKGAATWETSGRDLFMADAIAREAMLRDSGSRDDVGGGVHKVAIR